MDIERVNIVFNYDMPEDSDTYLHRVARAGRFGTKGLAITFVSDETDAKTLNDVQDRFDVNIPELPEEIDISSYSKSPPALNFIPDRNLLQSKAVKHLTGLVMATKRICGSESCISCAHSHPQTVGSIRVQPITNKRQTMSRF